MPTIFVSLHFKRAKLNPNAKLITGVICGYRIEEIENPLTKQARYLDKLVDELANGYFVEVHLSALSIQKLCFQAMETIELTSDEWGVAVQ